MTSISREQAIHLDKILQALLENEIDFQNVNKINENLIKDKSYEYCLSLFYILSEHYPRLLYPIDLSPDIFWATDYVAAFLHDGGFTNLYDSEAAKQEAENERQKLNDEKLAAEVDIVKFQKGLGKKFTIWAFIVSIISIVASVLTTVLTTQQEDNKPLPIDTNSLKHQLQILDLRVRKLEQQIHKDTIYPKK